MTVETKKTIRRLVISVLVFAAILLIGFIFFHKVLGLESDSEKLEKQVREYIEGTGAIAPLVFILASFLQVTFVPIPGLVTITAGDLLFGPWESFIYSFIGMMLGGMFAFFLGKLLGRPFADWVAGGKGKANEWLSKLRGKEKVLLFFMFLFPMFPDDFLCTVAGLLPITYLGFFVMQAITRATSIFGTLCFWTDWLIPLEWRIPLTVAGSVLGIVAFCVAFRFAERIDNFFMGFFRKVYYGEKYFLHKKKGVKAGVQTFVGKKVILDGRKWHIASFYRLPEGYVVDMYSRGAKNKKFKPKTNFEASLDAGDKSIDAEYKFDIIYYGKKRKINYKEKKQAMAYVKHYKRSEKFPYEFARFCFPVSNPEKKPDKLEIAFITESGQKETVDLLLKKKKDIDEVMDLVGMK